MHQISMITVRIESGNELSESIDGYPGFGNLQLHQSEMDLRDLNAYELLRIKKKSQI